MWAIFCTETISYSLNIWNVEYFTLHIVHINIRLLGGFFLVGALLHLMVHYSCQLSITRIISNARVSRELTHLLPHVVAQYRQYMDWLYKNIEHWAQHWDTYWSKNLQRTYKKNKTLRIWSKTVFFRINMPATVQFYH